MSDLYFYGIFLPPIIGVVLSSLLAIIFPQIKIIVNKLIYSILLIISTTFSFLFLLQFNKGTILTFSLYGGLKADWISAILLVLFHFIFLVAGLFSLYYIENKRNAYYTTLFFGLQLGMDLVLLASNLFLLFMFWELMVLTGYVLVVFNRTEEAYEAGIKYLIISSVGSLFMLFGIGLLTGLVDSLDFNMLAGADMSSTVGKFSLAFIFIGFGTTGGVVLFNQWLPDAHPAAPAPISTLLSGLLVKTGIYGIYRIFTLLLPDITPESANMQLFIILGIITMTEGNLMVFAQFMREKIDIKRILAYSTTVHLGYMLLVVGLNTSLGILALIYHIINHAIAKGMLFLISGYLIHSYGSRDLKQLKGIGRNDKILGMSLFIGLMSLGGLPLTGGFISKLLILISLYLKIGVATGANAALIYWAVVIAVINSAMAFGGYLWIVKYTIFDKPENLEFNKHRGDLWVKALFVLMAIIIIILGVFPFTVLDIITKLI